jgi:hypothetical protein
MGRLGFEPRTNRLKAECSTAELATRVIFSPYITVTHAEDNLGTFSGQFLVKRSIAMIVAVLNACPCPV